jgi:aspartyl-tRNA(Asn)/glutamyl-tRNA(Gln) amidotransferase subunit C
MLTLEDVQKIARLSKLNLTEAEQQKYLTELGNILGFVKKLEELNLEGVEATSHAVEVTDVFRSDEPRDAQVKDKALSQAPDREGDFFRVPKIL